MRHQLGVPGSELPLNDDEDRVPCVLALSRTLPSNPNGNFRLCDEIICEMDARHRN